MPKISNIISPYKFTVVKFIILFSALIVVCNTMIIIYRGVDRYNKQMSVARDDIESVTRAMGDHTELTLLAVDVVLKRAVEKHHFNLLFGGHLQQDTENNIIAWVDETPQISAMLIADENGEIKAIYRKEGYKLWMEGKEFVTQEPFFKSQLDEIDYLFVGKQPSFISGSEGFIVMSRRLEKLDGSFDGVIMAAINVNYLVSFFQSIEHGVFTKLIISHIGDDESIYSQLTSNDPEIKKFKENLSKYKKDRIEIKDTRPFITKSESEHDEKMRVYSFLDIPSVQLRAGIIFHEKDLLKDWNAERFSDAVLYVVFLLFVLVVAFFSVELARKVANLRISEKRALAASKAKSDFLANMSHELRTPLNAIIGFSEMLLTEYFGKVNDKQKERLKDIYGCGNHLLSLINDILEFSKGQAGKMEIRPEEVAIYKVVNESVRMFGERAMADGISIYSNVDKGLPHLFVDKRKIKQILINLISNSLKFTESGGRVDVSAFINDNEEFVLSVKDTGIGMREEDIPKALSAFGQVHKDRASAGTGLGLPLCKIFTELHGGTLHLESKVKVGTTVTIILPKKVIIREKMEAVI